MMIVKTINAESGDAGGGGLRSKLLAGGLAVAALIAVGAGGIAYAHGDDQEGSMMGGGGPGSMMENGGTGSMMDGGMMGGDETRAMGSFEQDKPFDLQFIDQMIMHHEGAIMSSEHMISDSKRPELRKLAESIQRSQAEQVERMQDMRKDWYPDAGRTFGMMDPSQMDGMMGDGMMNEMMEGMMGGSMRETMGADATDEMFLEMMIPHHQMAVEMSEKALEEADHPELKDLAQKIEDEQSAQIELMKGYLDEIEAASKS
ncbi:DUF305 domain-containing protein (plasmid) [Rubrobacter tropicus]|uniref:DUF305 domain-containing protein n=1 Tax=Rubrobacter tropicus TaxID=2653851 RepID=A0A6G8QFY8_9ACTN|nr:DUF305 domain-containing protein [Rubrobacter tropicus]